MRTPALLSAIALLTLGTAGCDNGGETDTSNPTDDTDPSYAEGCISVSSASQGFANLDDALRVATDGATIELCEDANVAIVVDKTLTIEGNGVVLTPPVNDMAVTVTADGALTIQNVEIQTTRSGIVVEAGGSLIADNIDIVEVANYGFDILGTATISNSTVVQPDWGAFRVDGGTATITGAEVTNAGAFGVLADNGADVTVQDCNFGGIRHVDASTQLWDIDGVGVWIEGGSSATLSGNTIVGAEITGVSVDGSSSLTMEGDRIIGAGATFAGITARTSSFEATGIEISDYRGYGILTLGLTAPANLASITVTTGHDTSNPNDAINDRLGSAGVYALETELVISGTEELPSLISGNNGAGVLVSPQTGGDTSQLTMSYTTVTDNVAQGIAVYSGDAELDHVTISETLNDDEYCITDTGYRCNMALSLWSSSATLTESSVTDSYDWGVTVVNGVFSATGGTFARNESNSIFGQGGSITANGVTFAEGRQNQITMQSNGSVLIDGSTFQDGDYTNVYIIENEDGSVTRQESYYQAREIYVSESDLIIRNSTFQNGQQGITAAGSTTTQANVTISDTTFTGYNQNVVYGSSNSDVTLERVTMEDIGRNALYCYSCDMGLSEVSISDVNTYDYLFGYYIDDEEIFVSESHNSDNALYFSVGSLSLEDVSIEQVDGRLLYATNTTVEMDGVTLEDITTNQAVTAAMDISWTMRTGADGTGVDPQSYPNAVLNNVQVIGPVGGYFDERAGETYPTNVMRFAGWTDSTTGDQAEGVIEVYDMQLGAGSGDLVAGGIFATNLGSFNMTGFDIAGVNDFGLQLDQVSGAITGTGFSRTGAVEAPGGILIDADRGTASASSISLTDVTVSKAIGDGITVNSGEHTFSGVTVTGAGGYGATCVDATFVTCDASLDGALGETDGCDACISVK